MGLGWVVVKWGFDAFESALEGFGVVAREFVYRERCASGNLSFISVWK
jgi:hypothetical protein